jgi:oligoribonuclease NrnB/cAMP/cGMP phosphodiesterase (DHH superfamily)
MIPEYNDNMKVVIVYHGGCLDGIASSWVIQHYFTTIKNKSKEDIILIGMAPQCLNLFQEFKNHGINFEINSYNIIFVDICPTIDILLKLIELNKQNGTHSRLEIYDHHITNKEIFKTHFSKLISNITGTFDMERCGCQIAWDEFMQSPVLGIPALRPWFIDYVAEGDLWKWELPDAKLIYGILQDNFKHIDLLDILYQNGYEYFTDNSEFGFKAQYLTKAKHIQEYKQSQIDKHISKSQHHIANITYDDYKVRSYNIWVVECMDIGLCSELGNQLTKKKLVPYYFHNNNDIGIDSEKVYPDFVLIIKSIEYNLECEHNTELRYGISLRSNKNTKPDINVANIASLYGGGGHPQAAGFDITHKELCNMLKKT